MAKPIKIIYVIMQSGRHGDEPVRRLPGGQENEFELEDQADAVAQQLAEAIPADLMGSSPRYFIRKFYTK